MTVFADLASFLPRSMWRRLQPHASSRERLIKLSLAFAGLGLIALWAQAPPSHAAARAAQAQTCPGTFTVLHNDRVGQMAVPRGAYAVRTTGVSCASASTSLGRFLDDFDGVLPGGWTTAATGIGFVNAGSGASIVLGTPSRPIVKGGCPGTFAVGHNDRIGALSVPKGAYVIRASRLSCAAASRQFAFFLFHDFAGRLARGWKLNVAARRFSRGRSSFTVTRAGGHGTSGGGVHPNLAITCPGTVSLAAGTSIGSLVLPAGRYYVNVFSDYSCTQATAAFKRFAAAGALPVGWTLEPETATFLLGKEGFQIEPVSQ
jgi:hypothetical protein